MAKKKVSKVKTTKKAGKASKPKKVNPIPKGYHAITPYLIIDGARAAIEIYQKVFGAKKLMAMDGPDGKVGHAEMKIGDSHFMLADECPEMGAKGPRSSGGASVQMVVYIKDVDSVAKKALAAGMKEVRPVQDQFYGDRMGTFEDPFGHIWCIATHIEDVSPAEMKKRVKAAYGNKPK